MWENFRLLQTYPNAQNEVMLEGNCVCECRICEEVFNVIYFKTTRKFILKRARFILRIGKTFSCIYLKILGVEYTVER